MQLPPETRVLPGHTDETTIGREWEENPFVRVWRGAEPRAREPCRVGGRGRDAARLVARLRRQGQGAGSASTTAATRSSAARAWNAASRSAFCLELAAGVTGEPAERLEHDRGRPRAARSRRPGRRRGRSGPTAGSWSWKIRGRCSSGGSPCGVRARAGWRPRWAGTAPAPACRPAGAARAAGRAARGPARRGSGGARALERRLARAARASRPSRRSSAAEPARTRRGSGGQQFDRASSSAAPARARPTPRRARTGRRGGAPRSPTAAPGRGSSRARCREARGGLAGSRAAGAAAPARNRRSRSAARRSSRSSGSRTRCDQARRSSRIAIASGQ